MRFITDKVKTLQPNLSYVEVSEDKQKTLDSLKSLKSQLEKLIDAIKQFPNIQYLRYEILKNYCKVPNFDIKLYDIAFVHPVIHSPTVLSVNKLDKLSVETPVVSSGKVPLVSIPTVPSFAWIDFPDFDFPDMPVEEPTPEPETTPTPTPNPEPIPTPTPIPDDVVSDVYPYDVTVNYPLPNPVPEPTQVPEQYPEPEPTSEQEVEAVPEPVRIPQPTPVYPPITTPDGNQIEPDKAVIWFPSPPHIEGVDFPDGSGHPVMETDGTTIKIGWIDDSGNWQTFKEGQVNISSTLDTVVYLLITTALLAAGSFIVSIGSVLDEIGIITGRAGVGFQLPGQAVSSCFLLDWGQIAKGDNQLLKSRAYDIIVNGMYNCASSQRANCEEAKQGMKLALILAELYPNELEVKENGMMYVSENSEILRSAVVGDITKQPIFIPNYNCDWAEPLRFLLLKNSEMTKDDFNTVSLTDLYLKLFGTDMKSDFQYWAEKIFAFK